MSNHPSKKIHFKSIAELENTLENLCLSYIEQESKILGQFELSRRIAGEKSFKREDHGARYINESVHRFHRVKKTGKLKIDILLEICQKISNLKKG
ncbi:hypothetical protein LEP1GSC193_0778 [Leptospira phage vB_LalZ_80412-LE1]|uniref:Uncharacterized protein n=1 Tax=Leptospira alstonii serovar Sichuan str. 79601 TaxID=1218565 RepID=M6CUI2_9LEPT|nr:hypothetical protein LEP1GSC193_0778 [Leptospira phage vB_LalZ_80412-LE1]EMJ95379.1 hypothetical protein LEP1GSC194_3578 [Leptospira alstonii serovar Sichuan str. 79601]